MTRAASADDPDGTATSPWFVRPTDDGAAQPASGVAVVLCGAKNDPSDL